MNTYNFICKYLQIIQTIFPKVESNCMEHRPVSAPVAATGRYTSHQHGPQAGPQVGLQGGPQVGLQGGPQVGLQTGNLAQLNHIQVV